MANRNLVVRPFGLDNAKASTLNPIATVQGLRALGNWVFVLGPWEMSRPTTAFQILLHRLSITWMIDGLKSNVRGDAEREMNAG